MYYLKDTFIAACEKPLHAKYLDYYAISIMYTKMFPFKCRTKHAMTDRHLSTYPYISLVTV